MEMINNTHNRDGSALLIALWIVVLSSMFIVSFTYDAAIESRLISYYRKRNDAEYLARSGVAVAEMLMGKAGDIKGETRDDVEAEEDRWYNMAWDLKHTDSVRLVEEAGKGEIVLDIRAEESRRNVNELKTDDWERILELRGIPEDLWPVLIESFQDWVDKDGNPRFDGAETEDYYGTLEEPYQAKNAALATVDELLLIRGFDRAILYGGELQMGFGEEDTVNISRGIADLLTVYGKKVNVNAAREDVLMTLPGIDEVEAVTIREEVRGLEGEDMEGNPFRNSNDFITRTQLPVALKKYITTDSKIYRINATGNVGGVTRTIQCIGRYDGKRLNVLRWVEGV